MKNNSIINYIILFVALVLYSCAGIGLPGKGRNMSSSKQCEILYKKRQINRTNDFQASLNHKKSKAIKLEYEEVKTVPFRTYQPNLVVEQLIKKNLFLKFDVSTEPILNEINCEGPFRNPLTAKFPMPNVNDDKAVNFKTNPTHENHKKGVETKKTTFLSFFIGIATLLGLFGLSLFKKRLRRISEWAALHPNETQTILTCSRVLIGAGAIFTGAVMAPIEISESATNIAVACVIGTLITYPSKNGWSMIRPQYVWRKAQDLTLLTSGTLLALSVGNNNPEIVGRYLPIEQFEYGSMISDFQYTGLSNQVTIEIDKQEPHKKNTVLKVIGIILALGAFAGLSVLLAALACNIACAGSEALALIILLGGEFGLIALLVTTIRAILGIKKKKALRRKFGDVKPA